jgi:signal peptidase I
VSAPTRDEDLPTAESPAAASRRPSAKRSFWIELPVLVIVALVVALLVKTFLVQAFSIPSPSMENTLQGGAPYVGASSAGHPHDRVLVNKLVYRFHGPRRGDIVVFRQPPGWPDERSHATSSDPIVNVVDKAARLVGLAPGTTSDFIKRVIGVAGDRVVCCNARNQITVNGHALVEPYVDLDQMPGSGLQDGAFAPFAVTVPRGEVFVMGDHRDNSSDSRVHGPVPVSDVIGRAMLVVWPISDWKTLPVPATFHQAGLQVAASNATPVLVGMLGVLPLAVFRGRRQGHFRKTAYAAPDA